MAHVWANGNHPSLDKFKESNGFEKRSITNYYIPLTRKGRIAIRLGLYREFRDAVPERLRGLLIPIRNWVSRIKARRRFGSETELDVGDNSNEASATNQDVEGKS